MSGNQYISAKRRGTGEYDQIPVKRWDRCNHTAYICTACAHMWNWDYELHFERTRAGRDMLVHMTDHMYPLVMSRTSERRFLGRKAGQYSGPAPDDNSVPCFVSVKRDGRGNIYSINENIARVEFFKAYIRAIRKAELAAHAEKLTREAQNPGY